jgi:hypothetical protein
LRLAEDAPLVLYEEGSPRRRGTATRPLSKIPCFV